MERSTATHRVIGKLIGNTGDPMRLQVALKDSFAARRGEFVRILHQEDRAEEPLPVLGRIVSLSRSNVLFSEAVSEGVADLTLLPGHPCYRRNAARHSRVTRLYGSQQWSATHSPAAA